MGRRIVTISEEALAALITYDWPGNVRELANSIEHAIVLGSGSVIEARDLPSRFAGESVLPASNNLSYRDGVNAARKELVIRALHKADGNRSAAARLLDLEAKYFLRLMKSLQIEWA